MATTDHDEGSLLDRAIDWNGSISDMVDICCDLVIDFNESDTDAAEVAVRKVCAVLLERADLPEVFRAQYLVFLVATEDDGDWAAMRSQLAAAETAVAQAYCPIAYEHAKCLDTVRLAETIQSIIEQVDAELLAPTGSPPFPHDSANSFPKSTEEVEKRGNEQKEKEKHEEGKNKGEEDKKDELLHQASEPALRRSSEL
ncbi:uncharacterized protein MYCGRDRAFT_96334 [Zymoseptoria tritici IPO323]|uniref:Uncharacterized protein n=1 Tax=Zymoseptoria tritici (strain CBS 115943 / IPO323) TaxID=336722 RepID=F9XLS4_ZYMTI|nr:uncharacterized protein MYCGRDRAFT_96334 [Zymoseptoria tritici IPO323]EGP84039.1 hypothetical protein MYCGRDRAFT_96334 [Zymoseptoria tritici IPO323]